MADDDVLIESSSSPSISNPGTPAANSKPGTPAPSTSSTPVPMNSGASVIKTETLISSSHGGKITPQSQTIMNQINFEARTTSSPALAKVAQAHALNAHAAQLTQNQHQSKYSQFLAVIEDMSRDIRPTYSGNKASMERLKRGIVHARILVRECLMECERSARS